MWVCIWSILKGEHDHLLARWSFSCIRHVFLPHPPILFDFHPLPPLSLGVGHTLTPSLHSSKMVDDGAVISVHNSTRFLHRTFVTSTRTAVVVIATPVQNYPTASWNTSPPASTWSALPNLPVTSSLLMFRQRPLKVVCSRVWPVQLVQVWIHYREVRVRRLGS